jgi:N-acetylgalactosamine kinase
VREALDTMKALVYKKYLSLKEEGFGSFEIDKQLSKYINGFPISNKKRKLLVSVIQDANNFNSTQLKAKANIYINGQSYDPEHVESSEYTNASVYIISRKAAEYSFPRIQANNIQGEEYLTDIVEILSETGSNKIQAVPVKNRHQIMSFNNVEELLEVENHYKSVESNQYKILTARKLKNVDIWIKLFNEMNSNIKKALIDIYGNDENQLAERRHAYLSVLNTYKEKYGNEKVVISRSPGRVNIMGRHIDHRGGNVNVMSINKEVIVVAGGRNDDRVCITNVSEDFDERDFYISEHLLNLDWESWLHYLESGDIEKLIKAGKGDWVNYVKAPIMRLQYQFRKQKLNGMNAVYTGNIPIAAGLSSSSAIVVSTAEAFLAVNNINITPKEFVELCGEGEWYVGSRGGAGDHAAMIFGEKGFLSTLSFLPFSLIGTFKFPDDYRLVIANSFIKANKTSNAKDVFNSRVASYEFGLMMLKDKFPELDNKMQHLRDVNEKKLGIPLVELYIMIKSLPEKINSSDLFNLISTRFHKRIKRILSSHLPPDEYYIRPVIMYGISECYRAEVCRFLLDNGKITEFGKLMDISHNGDRVSHYDNGDFYDYDWGLTDRKMDELIECAKNIKMSEEESIGIIYQSGGYACSTKEIDMIVDISRTVPGVVGAQISGAGLGGCVMIMVEKEAVENLLKKLKREYYAPHGLDNGLSVCIPVKGSGLLEI